MSTLCRRDEIEGRENLALPSSSGGERGSLATGEYGEVLKEADGERILRGYSKYEDAEPRSD